MSVVIIGNSTAAVGCVEGIRQLDPKVGITVIAREPHHTYSRPLISYLLAGKTDRKRMRYRPESFYQDNGVETLLGKTALSIDAQGKTVLLSDGSAIPYSKLLVATGSSPVVPPIPGLDEVKHKYTFMTLDDATALEQAVTKDSRVLILGAGLIGLKCAEGLAGRAGEITVVDLADHVLPSILDADAADLVARRLEDNGIQLVLSQSVQSFAPGEATLSGGGTLPFDVLVLAVGVRPNTGLVAEAGGEVSRGIVTDALCRTSLPDVYAAGDCAESFDITCGQRRVLALLPNAYLQGECAGIHMAGGTKCHDKAMPLNAIGFFGLHLVTAGSYSGEEYRTEKDGCYKRLFTEDNLLRGFILMGDVARAGIYTSLIRDRVPLDTVDFSLIKDRPQLMAFSQGERAKKLGGVTA